MKIRFFGPAEYDRFEDELKIPATVDGASVSIKITRNALSRIAEALNISNDEPLTIYAASGNLMEQVVRQAIEVTGEVQARYFLTHVDVLRATGSQPGLPHVPRRWNR